MYTLTLVATFFLPAQFLTGLYGMNFVNMPELTFEYGYLCWWLVIIALGLAAFFFLRQK